MRWLWIPLSGIARPFQQEALPLFSIAIFRIALTVFKSMSAIKDGSAEHTLYNLHPTKGISMRSAPFPERGSV